MATTRYVWGKYNISSSTTLSPLTTPITYYDSDGYEMSEYYPFPTGDADALYMHPDYYNSVYGKSMTEGCTIYYSTSASFTGISDGDTYELKLINPSTITFSSSRMTKSFKIPAGNYFCIESDTFWAITKDFAQNYCDAMSSDDDNSYYEDTLLETYSDEDGEERRKPAFITAMYAYTEYEYSAYLDGYGVYYINEYGTMRTPVVSGGTSQGSRIGYVSSTSSYAYPSDGVSGSYWYNYIGSGYIDPTAVALTATPTAGASATITVTARSNAYGTVSYLYQYSTNGGLSYTTIATSSATSYNFTVPSGTTSIIVRVRAQDNIGFTSSTYITSSSYTVNQYMSYAGVSGIVKGIMPRVCVGGSIKTSVTVKKGVNGVVK